VRVIVPPLQGCCGALALHLGDADGARRRARRLLSDCATDGVDWVLTSAAGCGAFLRELDHLLPGDPEAARLAAMTRDPLELLAELGLPPPERPLARTVAVHDPCHLAHGQGVSAAPRDLLRAIPGLELVELEEADSCCGSAGTYNLTEACDGAPPPRAKLDRIAASGAEVIAARIRAASCRSAPGP
jgi:glycolate oxidase iron-sulfur subunit